MLTTPTSTADSTATLSVDAPTARRQRSAAMGDGSHHARDADGWGGDVYLVPLCERG